MLPHQCFPSLSFYRISTLTEHVTRVIHCFCIYVMTLPVTASAKGQNVAITCNLVQLCSDHKGTHMTCFTWRVWVALANCQKIINFFKRLTLRRLEGFHWQHQRLTWPRRREWSTPYIRTDGLQMSERNPYFLRGVKHHWGNEKKRKLFPRSGQ